MKKEKKKEIDKENKLDKMHLKLESNDPININQIEYINLAQDEECTNNPISLSNILTIKGANNKINPFI